VREGSTEVFVPDPFVYVTKKSEYLPTSLPVFYNPLMEINRDLSILAIRTYLDYLIKDSDRDIIYVEALAGTGIRGFRVINEVGKDNLYIILNDINPKATDLISYNIETLNFPKDKIMVLQYEANYLLLDLRKRKIVPDVIEIDPYGSPAPFLLNTMISVRGKSGLVLVTATDTAPLVGKFPSAALRKYGCRLIKNPFSREIAVRALFYMLGREASIVSKRIIPLFGIFMHHFVKIAALISRGKKEADKFWRKIGWISFCPVCHDFSISLSVHRIPGLRCERDQREKEPLGPLWLGTIFNEEFCNNMLDVLGKLDIERKNAEKIKRILEWELALSEQILFYDTHEIAKRLKISPPAVNYVLEKLKSKGFMASRTHFNPRAVRTNAMYENIVELLVEIQKE